MCDINWLVLPDSERLTWTKELKHFLEFSLCWLETKFLLKKNGWEVCSEKQI